MISSGSAANRGWLGDVDIGDFKAAGLPVASLVRTAKIATIEAKDAEAIGTLPSRQQTQVRKILCEALPLK